MRRLYRGQFWSKRLAAAVLGLALGAGLALAPSTVAAAASDVYALRGAGQLSCGQYLQAYEEEGRILYMTAGWIDGYVTALNRVEPGVFEHLSWQETGLVLDLLRNHCSANPDDILANAMHLFVEATSRTRLTEQSTLVRIPAPEGGTVDVYEATLRRAQTMLAELGHYNAAVDGAYGPGTAAALRAFQSANGLSESGLPDQPTLLMLFAPTFQQAN